MKKIIFLIFITGIFLIIPRRVVAEKIISGSSAKLMKDVLINEKINQNNNYLFVYKAKKRAIRNIFERYNSPLLDYEDDFVSVCIEYELDCFLLPAIAGVESTFGKFVVSYSFNPFGWGGGYIFFKDWSEGINVVGEKLKTEYIDKLGFDTVEKIGSIYAESPLWPSKVNWFIEEFKKEEEKIILLYSKFNIKL